jgi:trehalose/maltose hydrolase-like predicted phosphorylase
MSIAVNLDRRFETCVADWDGTLVPDRASDAGRVRRLIEALSDSGFDVVVITGTNVENVDPQLSARPRGPGRLVFCVNRGSEVFERTRAGLTLLERRTATPEENAQLDRAASLTVERLAARGLEAAIVARRLNRRKVDIIPLAEWADPPKSRIVDLLQAVEERLHAAGIGSVAEVVSIAQGASAEAGLANARISSDAKHVEIGLTDKADSARWAFTDLWAHGIAASDVLVAGDEFGLLGGVTGSDSLMLVPESQGCVAVTVGAEPFGPPQGVVALPGGPDRILDVLEDQVRRRQCGYPPLPSPEGSWRVVVDGVDDGHERARSAMLTLADGRIGTRGVPILSHREAPETLVSGFYEGTGAEEHLCPAPPWNQLTTPLDGDAHLSRVLDLHSGVLVQNLEQAGRRVSAVEFSSLAEPGTAVMWAVGDAALLGSVELKATETEIRTEQSGSLVIKASDARRDDDPAVLERIAVFARGDVSVVRARAQAARAAGVNALHRSHREQWAQRWRDADICIRGDDELLRNVRFSLFQLMGAVGTEGEAALGARGLSGDGYRGHVFWDSDVFVLPFLAATCPAAARSMLEYRVRRLGAAMEQARALGLEGAKFPWESASSGREITPPSVTGPRGEIVRVRTGEMEDHIVADVAWAACRYVDWTGDETFRRGPLLRLLVETARYWASRIECDADGSAHIRHVIGPDEYHEDVDDNAFTNVMARWNLRAAVARATTECDESEARRWGALADALVDGLDRQSLVYEQFSGFSQLAPFPLRETYGSAPFAADSVIGFDRIQALQVLKQADALMLQLLVPGEVAPGSLRPNLDRYLPFTAHGSSLSPAVHAALLARLSRYPEALELLRLAARIDIDDVSKTSAHGLHVATMGGVWLAMAEGFAGIQADGDGLCIRPRLPDAWEALTVHLVYRGQRVRLQIEAEEVKVDTSGALRVVVATD